EWSYHGLEVAVTAAADWLCSHNLSRGAHVAAYGVNSDAYLIGFLACARAGLVHVPINYALSGNELSYLLTQSDAEAVLVDPDLAANIEAVRAQTSVATILPLTGPSSLLEASQSDAAAINFESPETIAVNDLLQLLYTSGTTSKS